MFYGKVSYNATIDAGFYNSNNWTLARANGSSEGYYKITLGQYLNYVPSVTAMTTQNFGNGEPSGPMPNRTIATAVGRNSNGAVEIFVTTRVNGNLADMGFCFTARCGCRRVFEVTSAADTLTLEPEIVSFNGTKILVLKTSSLGLGSPLYVDKGSVLIGVGTTMKLELGSTTVSDGNGNTWDLTGWTYGGGFGAENDGTGTQWAASPRSGSANYLTVDPGGTNGPVTTPYTFAIKGVLSGEPRNGAPVYVSSDPVVRLSAVSPGGLTL